MAECYCRWRTAFICVCTSCIFLALFLYAGIMVCSNMNHAAVPGAVPQMHGPQSVHLLAPGAFNNKRFVLLPKTFWNLHEDAFWNTLQLAIDRHFNPILNPQNTRTEIKNSTFQDSIRSLSFSEVTDLESMRRTFKKLPQHMQEFVNHMNKRDYPVIIQPGTLCGAGARDEKEPPLLLLAIKTTELNFKNRQAIRQTWGQVGWVAGQKYRGQDGGYIRRVFLLGKQRPQEQGINLSELLRIEGKYYGDILQWDFNDTFFNLTLKDVLFWSWFSHHCNQTLFVFKGDDDVFVNTPNMITYLQDQLRKPQSHKTMNDFMVGDVIGAAIPNRVNKSKYFVPDSFYKGVYPTYAGGGGVLYSGLLTKRLHHIAKRVHLFPIDDVFVGMCMIRLNASPIHHPAFLTFDLTEKEEKDRCVYHKILLVHKRDPRQVLKLWADVKDTQKQCWNVPLRGADEMETKMWVEDWYGSGVGVWEVVKNHPDPESWKKSVM